MIIYHLIMMIRLSTDIQTQTYKKTQKHSENEIPHLKNLKNSKLRQTGTSYL